jgi:hypothetical protein
MKQSKHDELVERFLTPMTVDDMKKLVSDAINAVGEFETENEKLRDGVVHLHGDIWLHCGCCTEFARKSDCVQHAEGCPMEGYELEDEPDRRAN